MSSKKTWSWRTRLLLLLLLFAVLPMLGIGIWNLHKLKSTFQSNTLEQLEAISRARAAAIDQLIQDRRRDVEVLAPQFIPHLMRVKEAMARAKAKARGKAKGEARDENQEPVAPEPLLALQDGQVPPARSADGGVDAGAAADAGRGDGGLGPGQPGTGDAGAQASAAQKPAPAAQDTPANKALADAKAELQKVLGLILWDQQVFEELLVIADDGVVVASTFTEHEGKTAKGLDYFEKGLATTYLQPVFISPITEELTMVISSPIRQADHELIGVLAARVNLRRFFRLLNDVTGMGTSGEIVVGKKIEGVVVLMAPTRHDAQAALQRSVQLGADYAIPLQEAARGFEGKGVRMDYRRIETLASWQPILSLGWGLVAKIDYAEAMSDVQAVRLQFAFLAVALLMVVIIAAFVVSRELVRPLRVLKDATDRISRGDLDVQLEIRSNDEIGELADSFERMVAAIKFFREHARKADEDLDETSEAPAEGQ